MISEFPELCGRSHGKKEQSKGQIIHTLNSNLSSDLRIGN